LFSNETIVYGPKIAIEKESISVKELELNRKEKEESAEASKKQEDQQR